MRVKCDESGIRTAGDAIRDGRIVVFPTDTVYGIGCDPYNRDAVRRIFEIKSRDPAKHMPVLAYDIHMASRIAEIDPVSAVLARAFWPGQLTLVLDLRDARLEESMGLGGRIAVRVPGNGCTRRLLERCGILVGTSANMSGTRSTPDPDECAGRISGFDVLVDGGVIDSAGESTVAEVIHGDVRIVRQGVLGMEEIGQWI